MKVLVLGAGKMTSAILRGLKRSQDLSSWVIYSPTGISAKKIADEIGATAIFDLENIPDLDWILIGCKPQQLPDLEKILAGKFKNKLFVSMLAAISEEDQLKRLPSSKLIRIMPNLPVEFNVGVTLLSSKSCESELGTFHSLFSKLGMATLVSEQELEELTLLTGSGPALFYEFARNLAQSFDSLDEQKREDLVRQVLKGCAVTCEGSQQGLLEMTDSVTSKGGVTIAVLEQWRHQKFKEFIFAGIKKGKDRAMELRSILRS